jgi:hypothetical protein
VQKEGGNGQQKNAKNRKGQGMVSIAWFSLCSFAANSFFGF